MQTGTRATAATIVSPANTAESVGSGDLPVFATPMMIALMEQAACNCLVEALGPGQTSVGTEVNIAHTAASPLGAEITATAEITQIDGRKITFAVSARDEKNEVGRGTHTRVLVDRERFMGRLLS